MRPRVRRPADPLRPTARELVWNGFLKILPRTPGALPPARAPAPSERCVPRSGWWERRGTKKAGAARTTHSNNCRNDHESAPLTGREDTSAPSRSAYVTGALGGFRRSVDGGPAWAARQRGGPARSRRRSRR